MTMVEDDGVGRPPAAEIANMLEKQFHSEQRRITFNAISKDEAVLIIHELKERGYRAELGWGLVWDEANQNFKMAHIVDATLRRKPKPANT